MSRATILDAHPVRLLRAQQELRELALWATPPFALLTSFAVLQSAELWLGERWGFAIGLGFYWIVWCALVPFAVLGADGLRKIFARGERALRLRDALLLMIPPVVGFSTIFPLLLWIGNGQLFAAAAVIALLNGTFEEVLWRGAYLQIFGKRLWGGVVYPALGFGLWHIAPIAAHWSWSAGRGFLLALAATLVGLAYGYVARHTSSIRWTIFSHVLMNFAGLGVLSYFA
jgi:hypothetical protein